MVLQAHCCVDRAATVPRNPSSRWPGPGTSNRTAFSIFRSHALRCRAAGRATDVAGELAGDAGAARTQRRDTGGDGQCLVRAGPVTGRPERCLGYRRRFRHCRPGIAAPSCRLMTQTSNACRRCASVSHQRSGEQAQPETLTTGERLSEPASVVGRQTVFGTEFKQSPDDIRVPVAFGFAQRRSVRATGIVVGCCNG